MFEVRFAIPSDIEFCRARDFSIKESEALLKKIAANEIIVAFHQGTRVGYLRTECLRGKIPYMSVINVIDDYQGRGSGSAMFLFLETQLRPHFPFLITSAEANAPRAMKWHLSHGFKECGYIDGLNPNDIREVFLKKQLS
jgi:hypothetical protein